MHPLNDFKKKDRSKNFENRDTEAISLIISSLPYLKFQFLMPTMAAGCRGGKVTNLTQIFDFINPFYETVCISTGYQISLYNTIGLEDVRMTLQLQSYARLPESMLY